MALTEITRCEVCDNPLLTSVMNLGDLPMPDDLVPVGDARVTKKYPTEILFCSQCKTAYQRWVIPNKEVFPAEYHFRSGNTKEVVLGMEQLVDAVEEHLDRPVSGLKILDIGCNDGSLLDVFRRRGAITTGIEPTDAGHEAAAKGHGIDNAYLDFAEAFRYVKTYGHPDVITFVNVFAHITGLRSVLGALEIIRGENTMFVIENHYLGSVIAGNQFDTFYHEHPRTYSFSSFAHIAKTMGMHVAKVQYPKRYAGNIRVFLKPGRPDWGRNPYNNDEIHFGSKLSALDEKVQEWRVRKEQQLRWVAPLAAAAFPGRAAVIVNLLELTEKDITAVYENPVSKKVGHYVPGTRIPIKSDAEFPWAQYDGPVLNLAWHIADEIEHNWRAKGFKGTFIQAIEPKDFA